jgi:prepilin-type N-terminal cleavage/methylation domain-containing protein
MPMNVPMREDANSRTCRKEQGFTLVEVIVVLSVVLLLTGIAVPMLSTYMEDGRRARAESECKTIGAAVLGFYKDVGVYPSRNSSSSNNTLTVLMTGPSIPSTSPWNAAHAWITDGTGSNGDVLDNHLVLNQPQSTTGAAYPMTGVTRWRGPYTGPLPVDPWGRPYIVNMQSGWSVDTTNYKRVWVISAGADGIFQSNANASATDDILGDDIGYLLSQRQ